MTSSLEFQLKITSCAATVAFAVLLMCTSSTLLASGNANVVLQGSSANGAWSFVSSTYTWTPNADNSTVNVADIVACLLGTNTVIGAGSGVTNASTNGAASVTILTACSGTGGQSGNVTTSSSITAATTSATQFTFTITAAGSITISNAINFTPASNISTGYPATNIVLTGPTAVTTNGTADLTTTGGASSGSDNPGGAAGSITFTSSGGAISTARDLQLKGAPGGTGSTGGNCTGGAGGNLTFSGTSISLTAGGTPDCSGGNATGTGTGGAGGAFSFTATSTTVSVQRSITSNGGNGGTANGSPGHGGAAGSVTYTAATSIDMNVALNAVGGSGAGNGNGGVGGTITFTATAGSIVITNNITANGGSSGASTTDQSGGNGGAILLSAGSTYSNTVAVASSGGTCRGTGYSNGGNISITGTTGINISNSMTTSAGTGGAAGTGGTFTINDGNTTVTSGGANDGQTAAAWTGGAFVKTGAGNFSLGRTANSWAGATTITAGKLTLGAAGVIPNASNLYFNGGRLVMGAYSETVDSIMVNAYSVLDLPSGNYTLTATASNGVTWTTGMKLGILNWGAVGDNYNGTLAGGSDPKFFIGGSAGLDATHLAAIYFTRPSNSNKHLATQLASGEIVPSATLPVKLISFDAVKNNQTIDISWSTASEINSDYFDIMRCGIDSKWELISTVRAAGNSNKILHYSINDVFPRPGINYYKMVEYDFDGAKQESKVVSISNPLVVLTQLTAFPNPTSNTTTFIFYTENAGTYYLKVFSTSGEQVYKALLFGNEGENRFSINMQDYAEGTYSFQLYSEAQMLSEIKVVKGN
jgi:hypothetical protein